MLSVIAYIYLFTYKLSYNSWCEEIPREFFSTPLQQIWASNEFGAAWGTDKAHVVMQINCSPIKP